MVVKPSDGIRPLPPIQFIIYEKRRYAPNGKAHARGGLSKTSTNPQLEAKTKPDTTRGC